ncbi:ABC transporter ATP-binding protein [Metabacillus halosaccharovorans]|uniref:ABC transporter ATP-binding protein n=1 Tax=Metabacillus halosaccharovorans TaxID=930124 RepID=UPI001C1F5533|nr:ABC transporter ATP-binding protein [Metabacillus halosaccharovorans]MBU7591126.1 ABC transporter ATP-binding protein [Metabacillus halosaccharovorans]
MTNKGRMITPSEEHRNNEHSRDVKGTITRLARYLKPEGKILLVVSVFAIASTFFNVFSPKILGEATTSIFNSVTTNRPIDFDFIGRIMIFLILLYLLSSLFTFLQAYLMAGVSQRAVAALRKEVNEKLTRLPIKFFDQHSYGDLLSKAVNDVDNINNSFQQALTQIITSVITVVGIIVMMLVISPLLTLVIAVTVPLSLFIIRFIFSRSQKYFKHQQNKLGKINGHVEEMYTCHQVVKAYGYEETSIERFDEMNESLYKVSHKAQFISGIMNPMMNFVGNIGFVFVSILGGIFVLNGSLLIGNVQAFLQYSKQITQPMMQVAGIANMIQNGLASAERIFDLLDEEEEAQEKDAEVDLDRVKGNVTFEHVCFGYEKDSLLMKDINLDITEGQTIAIVGPTGAGKTTLINLLMRFYELTSGRILIDGVDIQMLSREQVRGLFSMVLQDTWLFHGTIRENIGYGKKGATEEEIINAAYAAYADDFIRKLPKGYDTMLDQEATNLSHGQKQLLTIARAIISDPKILILDEATSSVDTRTELNIQKAMNSLMKNRTSFIIAHRLSTIKNADLIIVMNNGAIIEKGTHQQLIEQKGFYANLYNSQFNTVAEKDS